MIIAIIVTRNSNVSFIQILIWTILISILSVIPFYLVFALFNSVIAAFIIWLIAFYFMVYVMVYMLFGTENKLQLFSIIIIHFCSIIIFSITMSGLIDFIAFW